MRCRRAALGISAAGLALTLASGARAAETPASRVAVLGPADASMLTRIRRNLASMHHEVVGATVQLCTRDVVTRLADELAAEAVVCFDGDAISVWKKADGRLALADVVVSRGKDDRAEEVDAARATLALADGGASARPVSSGPLTIVTSGSDAAPAAQPAPTKEAAPRPPRAASMRIAPRGMLSAGPAILSSTDGSLFAISATGAIAVTRNTALVPWMSFAPSGRLVETAQGSARYRPTLFGLGFDVSLLPTSSFVVPRLGAGYTFLWVHVWPESAKAPAVQRDSEDLLIPCVYMTGAASFAVAPRFRIAAEALGGVCTHEAVVRIAGASAATWGGALSSLALRGEWVFP